nr:MAG TPA: hypothetical protein [Caudoviricetes sp.]
MLEVANLALLQKLTRRSFARRTIIYVGSSQQWTVPASGVLVIRCLGAGGSGAAISANSATTHCALGGEAGTVGLKTLHAKKGDVFTLTLGAGGAAVGVGYAVSHGRDGGTTTVTGPGADIKIPGGKGGQYGAPAAGQILQNPSNDAPTGLDWFVLNARNRGKAGELSGGGAAALLVGGSAHAAVGASTGGGAGVGSDGASTPGSAGSVAGTTLFGEPLGRIGVQVVDVSHCWLLLDVSGTTYFGGTSAAGYLDKRYGSGNGGGPGSNTNPPGYEGGFGAGGGGASYSSTTAGAGGRGGGGGATNTGGKGSGSSYSGAGGNAFVTLELLETQP